MNVELKAKLEVAIRRLADRDPDGAAEDNEIGFSSRDVKVGHSLARQIGRWTPAQTALVWKLCSVYRNTQLADLGIPAFDKGAADAFVEGAVTAQAATVNEADGFGLTWSPERQVKTMYGPRGVSSALVPDGHAFWAVWRRDKEALKAKGYAPKQDNGRWILNRWRKLDASTQPAPARGVDKHPETAQPATVLPQVNTAGLLPYQVPSVQRIVYALRAYGISLDASDVGTGKTYAALAAVRELGLKPLVICPKSVIPSWKKAAKHFGLQIEAINYELIRRGSTPHATQLTDDRNHTSFQFHLAPSGAGILIFDEVHRCKAQSSLNSKLLIAAARQDIPTICLSATAATNPLEMKAIGFALGLFDNPSQHWRWAQKHGCSRGKFGGLEWSGDVGVLRSLHHHIFGPNLLGTRIKVADLGDAFPETQIAVQLLELNGKTKEINEAYRLAQEAIDRVKEKRATDGDSPLTLLLRARQISEAAKIPMIVDQIEDAIEQGLSVAVFVNFQDSIDTIRAALPDNVGSVSLIHGGQTAEERQEAIDAFQADRNRVIIANIQAGGVGVSLHDLNGNHPRLALISPTWSAVDLRQTLGRVHRAGGKSKSLQRLVYAAGTVEEQVAATVESKLIDLDTLNDGVVSDLNLTEATV